MAMQNILLGTGRRSQAFVATGVRGFVQGTQAPKWEMVTCIPATYYSRTLLSIYQSTDGVNFAFSGDARDWWPMGRIYSLTHGTSINLSELFVTFSPTTNVTYFLHESIFFTNYETTDEQTFYIETK